MGRFFELLRAGTNLPIHTVVMDVNGKLESIESGHCLIDHVSENRDISIDLHETSCQKYELANKTKQGGVDPVIQIQTENQ